MGKTTTRIEYAALTKRPDGSWFKLHPFFCKSEEQAMRVLQAHYKRLNKNLDDVDYKIMARTVTITAEEWHDI